MLKRQRTRRLLVATKAAASAALPIHPQAVQAKTIARHLQGAPMATTLAGAEGEVEGFLRT